MSSSQSINMENIKGVRAQKMNPKQKEFLVNEVSKLFERAVPINWNQIAAEVNQFGPPVKDGAAWKKSFEHAKSKSKTKTSGKSDLDRKLESIGSSNSTIGNRQYERNARRSRNEFTAHELLTKSLENQEQFLKEIREQRKEQHSALVLLNRTCHLICDFIGKTT